MNERTTWPIFWPIERSDASVLTHAHEYRASATRPITGALRIQAQSEREMSTANMADNNTLKSERSKNDGGKSTSAQEEISKLPPIPKRKKPLFAAGSAEQLAAVSSGVSDDDYNAVRETRVAEQRRRSETASTDPSPQHSRRASQSQQGPEPQWNPWMHGAGMTMGNSLSWATHPWCGDTACRAWCLGQDRPCQCLTGKITTTRMAVMRLSKT